MLSRIQSLGSCLIVLALLLFAGSAIAQDVSPRCAAAMDRAAGHYSKCLLSADASYARHGNATKLANRQARCETRFERHVSRAFRRHGADACPSSNLVVAMADRTASFTQAVAKEAQGEEAPSLLFVQDAEGGALTGSTLTLTGVSSQTGWFTDRPYRKAGRMTTADFVALFYEEGVDSFADNPPNADFTCESDGTWVNRIVTLSEPIFDEEAHSITYSVNLVSMTGDPDSFAGVTCDADVHLFIDSETGLPAQSVDLPPLANMTLPVCKITSGEEAEQHIAYSPPCYSCFAGGQCGSDGFNAGPFAGDTCQSTGCCDFVDSNPNHVLLGKTGWEMGARFSKFPGASNALCLGWTGPVSRLQ